MASQLTKKQERQALSSKKQNRATKVLKAINTDPLPCLDSAQEKQLKQKFESAIKETYPDGVKPKQLKENFRVGVNETLKSISKELIGLVLINKSNLGLTQLVVQSALANDCPVIVLPDLKGVVAGAARVQNCASLGFLKTCTGEFAEVMEYGASISPAMQIPWKEFEEIVAEQAAADAENPKEQKQTPKKSPKPSPPKRKITPKSEEKENGGDDMELGSSYVALGADSDDDLEGAESESKRVKLVSKEEEEEEEGEKGTPRNINRKRGKALGEKTPTGGNRPASAGNTPKSARKGGPNTPKGGQNTPKGGKNTPKNTPGSERKGKQPYRKAKVGQLTPNSNKKRKSVS